MKQLPYQQKNTEQLFMDKKGEEQYLKKLQVKWIVTLSLWVSGARQYTKKFLQRFDTRFGTKMMVKMYAIEIIFTSH